MTASASRRLTLLLPAWASFGRQPIGEALAVALGRADAESIATPSSSATPSGSTRTAGVHVADPVDATVDPTTVPRAIPARAQLERHFTGLPQDWSAASLTRRVERDHAAGIDADTDADGDTTRWLRADPAHVRPDLNGARLLGIGERLALSQADVDALLPELQALFDDDGIRLDAPHPARWYLRLPPAFPVPHFSDPDTALGEDLFDHQPTGPEARRWRSLLNEVQIVLHNHPWNAARNARGLAPVNALWVWGEGVVPSHVTTDLALVCSDDDLVRALALAGGGEARELPPAFAAIADRDGHALVDLRHVRDLAALRRDWLEPALTAIGAGRLARLGLDSLDGRRFQLARAHRLRFWRRPWTPPA